MPASMRRIGIRASVVPRSAPEAPVLSGKFRASAGLNDTPIHAASPATRPTTLADLDTFPVPIFLANTPSPFLIPDLNDANGTFKA